MVFVSAFFLACKPGLRSEEDIVRWISSPENGLYKKKQANGLEVSCKFMPPEYLALRESKNGVGFDSILETYGNSLVFLLTIKPDADKDLMFLDVEGKEEFNQRFYDLNFSLSEYLRLESGSQKIKPALYVMENTYGLSYHRSFNVIFEKGAIQVSPSAKDLDVVFNDVFFETGISHFKFQLEDINKFPSVKLTNKHE